MKFRDYDFSSPALALGIQVLQVLNASGPMSLDELTRILGGSKSSLLRHLRTLAKLGLVEQRSRTAWGARSRLVPNVGLSEARERFRSDLMDAVAEASGFTVEWYQGLAEGMMLRDQRLGRAEVHVVARPGFLRPWGGEVDAVARLGYAFDPSAPAAEGPFWRYSRNGQRREIQVSTVLRAVRAVRRAGMASDRAFNTNLVRRSAVAVRYGEDYLGVLAVAEPYSFHGARAPDTLLDLITRELNHANSLY